jgi:hypothetical protein
VADSSSQAVRWYIVHKADGETAAGSPGDGFDSHEAAEEFYLAVFQGDPALEIREAANAS